MRGFRDLIERGLDPALSWLEKAKLLEMLFRIVSRQELAEATQLFVGRWRALGHTNRDVLALLRTLFNETALSPYTDLVEKSLAFLDVLQKQGVASPEDVIDFLSMLLRQLVRHLTAYDLVTFHHRGANYPDALLLDAMLKAYLRRMEHFPELFLSAADDEPGSKRKRLRRRALRQAWFLRRRYEGHLVPDAPTSPGENARVLPPPYVRVPEEQILDPSKRTRRLFDGDPLPKHLGAKGREILSEALGDLRFAEELRELGMALFLDRPLSGGKAPLEPDQTLLFSYEAFSRSIAERRLASLATEAGSLAVPVNVEGWMQPLHTLRVEGIPLHAVAGQSRPGSVSLADARKVAGDFVFVRTTRQTVEDFLRVFDFSTLQRRYSLDFLAPGRPVLILREFSRRSEGNPMLAVYDEQIRKRLELAIPLAGGYVNRGGVEFPAVGLAVVRCWESVNPLAPLREHDLRAEPVLVPPQSANQLPHSFLLGMLQS